AVALQVETLLSQSHELNKRLKGRIDLSMAMALGDIKAQLAGLIYRGFVPATAAERLGDVSRYLTAVARRLDRLAIDPHRDRAHLVKVQQVQNAYQTLLNKQPKGQPLSPDVAEIRWMIEELRVSY